MSLTETRVLGGLAREGGFHLPGSQAYQPGAAPQPGQSRWSWPVVLAALVAALVAGLGLGLGVGLGLSTVMLVLGLLAPFGLLVVLARPHWASIIYLVLVYTDLLSILVRYHDFPSLARFIGMALVTAVLGYRVFVQHERPAGDRLTWWLIAYGLMVALGVVYARNSSLVVDNMIEFLRDFFTYLIVINSLTTIRRMHVALYAVMAAGVFLASLTIFQAVTGRYDQDFGGLAQYRVSDIAGDTEGARPGGTIGDANYYGQLLLIVVPIALYLLFEARGALARLAGLVCSGILLVAVILTYSRGDALALGVIAIAVVIFKRPNPLLLVGGVVALLLAVPLLPSNYMERLTTIVDVAQGNQLTIIGEDSIRGRAGATQAAIEMFADHPLIGVGRENYPLYQLDYLEGTEFARVSTGIPPHNLYLEVAAEHGVMGIIVFGGLLVTAWLALIDARRRFKFAGATREHQLAGWLAIVFIGYLVTAMSLHGAFLYMLWMIISLIAALRLIARSYVPVLPMATVTVGQVNQGSNNKRIRRTGLRGWFGRNKTMATSTYGEVVESMESPQVEHLFSTVILAEEPGQKKPDTAAWNERSAYVRRLGTKSTAQVARLETWLSTGEAALSRGDLKVARVMVELALERDPYNLMAWDMDLRIRLNGEVRTRPGKFVAWNAERPMHDVYEKMFGFWHTNGGVPVFGYPITPRFYEISTQGELIDVQYFEKARLEYYPKLAGTPDDVQCGNLGLEMPITGSGSPVAKLPRGLDGEQVIFEDGMEVPQKFFDFWVANGGPHVFGAPISHVLLDTNANGKDVWVQYFKKAALEYHPRLADTVYGVQVSQLGAVVFESKYGQKVGQ